MHPTFDNALSNTAAGAVQTGGSKHFAFVEFKHKEVAAIAAEAMNNYLMLGKILKVHVMPTKDLHPKMCALASLAPCLLARPVYREEGCSAWWRVDSRERCHQRKGEGVSLGGGCRPCVCVCVSATTQCQRVCRHALLGLLRHGLLWNGMGETTTN